MLKNIWKSLDGKKTVIGLLGLLASQINWIEVATQAAESPEKNLAVLGSLAIVIIGLVHKTVK